jgi:hypothetical protein
VTDLRARLDEVDGRLNAAASLLANALLDELDHDAAATAALRHVEQARQQIAALWGELALTGWP